LEQNAFENPEIAVFYYRVCNSFIELTLILEHHSCLTAVSVGVSSRGTELGVALSQPLASSTLADGERVFPTGSEEPASNVRAGLANNREEKKGLFSYEKSDSLNSLRPFNWHGSRSRIS
jgi:hypothetical protein